ncbi:hypothetical protein ACTMU2_40535 [Cupriavidus basilensis]
MAYDVRHSSCKCSRPNWLDLLDNSPAGDIPNGEAKGTAIISPGRCIQRKHGAHGQPVRVVSAR